jgi:hypothetical protein
VAFSFSWTTPGTPPKVSTTSAAFSPVAPLVFIEIGTSIVPPAGIVLPTRSSVVQVQLGALRTQVTGWFVVLRSMAVNFTSERGCTNPASTDAGSAFTGHSAICRASSRSRVATSFTCADATGTAASRVAAASASGRSMAMHPS